MERDLRALSDATFDLVVVGGGIHGICSAWDAAQRGLSVALVERGDFFGATSSNSLKILHGGLRDLRHGDLRRTRFSIRERRTLLSLAPHLVKPQGFVVPTGGRFSRSRLALGTALALNDFVGLDRNDGLDPSQHLPAGRMLSKEECVRTVPGLSPEGVTGGALYHDALMRSPERLGLSFLHNAADAGVVATNRVEALRLLRENGRMKGVLCRDLLCGAEIPVSGKVVLNAAGPWLDELSGAKTPLAFSMSLVLRRTIGEYGFGLGNGRLYFLVPWRGVTLCGTGHRLYRGDVSAFAPAAADVRAFLDEVNAAHPAFGLSPEEVSLFHAGLLPATRSGGLLRRHRILDGGPGLLTIRGVQYTTFRGVAEEAVDSVFAKLERTPPPCRTAETPVRGGEARVSPESIVKEAGLDLDVAEHLAGLHGAAWRDLLPYLQERPGRLSPKTPVQRGEVLFAARKEMAVSLGDVVFRRTELGTAGPPDAHALEECARVLAGELGWDADRLEAEKSGVAGRFVPAAGEDRA